MSVSDAPDPVNPSTSDDGSTNPKPTGKKRRRKRNPKSPLQRNGGVRVDRSVVRHQARVVAMQTLFELDQTDHELEPILERLASDEVEDLPAPVLSHATRIIRGVLDAQAGLDPHIEAAAPAFPMIQLAAIDRVVLRIAVYELTKEPDVPFRAVINEAIEIAKHYGGPNSGRFVNGVLGTIHDRLESETVPPGES